MPSNDAGEATGLSPTQIKLNCGEEGWFTEILVLFYKSWQKINRSFRASRTPTKSCSKVSRLLRLSSFSVLTCNLADLQTSVSARQKLESQQQENKGVQKEFSLLPPESSIYKLVGPVLLKQERSEAVMAVEGRLEFIEKEMYALLHPTPQMMQGANRMAVQKANRKANPRHTVRERE